MKIKDVNAIPAVNDTASQQDLKPVQKNLQVKNEKEPNSDKNETAEDKIKIFKADTDTLNKLAVFLDYDLRFKIHKATNQLIVQVVDPTTYPEKIIKEIPEEKFLDILAQLKNAVGTFMDDYV
ncbi:MAG TPA: hypothetical protein DCK76_09175 [Desulfotomaculum sp.]|nr:MAG: hypothetical protein XD84_0053 [Desulfotomaculum sp. 46_80]HAG11534.1 hypothetical protein [Desulfotomaculum sp.]HBY03762.1 hypothetical protein [Desulfotomaculum sp.]